MNKIFSTLIYTFSTFIFLNVGQKIALAGVLVNPEDITMDRTTIAIRQSNGNVKFQPDDKFTFNISVKMTNNWPDKKITLGFMQLRIFEDELDNSKNPDDFVKGIFPPTGTPTGEETMLMPGEMKTINGTIEVSGAELNNSAFGNDMEELQTEGDLLEFYARGSIDFSEDGEDKTTTFIGKEPDEKHKVKIQSEQLSEFKIDPQVPDIDPNLQSLLSNELIALIGDGIGINSVYLGLLPNQLEIFSDLSNYPLLTDSSFLVSNGFTDMHLVYQDSMGSNDGITLGILEQGEKTFISIDPSVFDSEFNTWQLAYAACNPSTNQCMSAGTDLKTSESSPIKSLLVIGGLIITSKLLNSKKQK